MKQPIVAHSVRWHERRVVALAEAFSRAYVTSAGYGGPVARAGGLLNEAVEQMIAARKRSQQPPSGGEK